MLVQDQKLIPSDVRQVVGSIDKVIGLLQVNNTFVGNNITLEYYKLLDISAKET